MIRFDDGEDQHYKPSSFRPGRFTLDGVDVKSVEQLKVGSTVTHWTRGTGRVIEFRKERDISVCFLP